MSSIWIFCTIPVLLAFSFTGTVIVALFLSYGFSFSLLEAQTQYLVDIFDLISFAFYYKSKRIFSLARERRSSCQGVCSFVFLHIVSFSSWCNRKGVITRPFCCRIKRHRLLRSVNGTGKLISFLIFVFLLVQHRKGLLFFSFALWLRLSVDFVPLMEEANTFSLLPSSSISLI